MKRGTGRVLGITLLSALPAFAAADLEVRVLPLLTPSPSSVTTLLPSPVSQVDAEQAHVWEVWISDVGSSISGVVSAYIDLHYDSAWVNAIILTHGAPFESFISDPSSIDDGAGLIDEFGGTNGAFQPQGLEPDWARLGYIDVVAGAPASPQWITGWGEIGTGGIGVYGRVAGDLSVSFTPYIVPEPASAALLGTLALLSARRRRSPRPLVS